MRHLLILLFLQWCAAQDYNKPIKIGRDRNMLMLCMIIKQNNPYSYKAGISFSWG